MVGRPPLESEGDVPEMKRHGTVRVLSWNLWWRFGDWSGRYDAIRSVLTEARPDVCGLQEVWDGPEGNLAALLAGELGMQWVWSRVPSDRWGRRIGDTGIGFGNAVLSRWPIAASDSELLPPGSGPDGAWTALHALVDAPSGPLPFFTTQLCSAPDRSALRCAQVRALAGFIDARSGSGHPPVVTGDLNAEPDSDEVRMLCGHKTAPAVPGLVLVDAWRYADSPADPGWTWNPRNPHVAATYEPAARIDYVLVGLPAAGGAGHVRRVGLVGAEPVGGVWPSDHAAVLAELAAGY